MADLNQAGLITKLLIVLLGNGGWVYATDAARSVSEGEDGTVSLSHTVTIKMWEQEEFVKHWRNEFPDGEVPRMDLHSVEDIESELEACKANLKKLQQALKEEKFKVIYLQTTVVRLKKTLPEKAGGRGACAQTKTENVRKPPRQDQVSTGEGARGPDSGGVKSNAGRTPNPLDREQGRFSGRTGKAVPIPVPPLKPSFNKAPASVPHDEEGSDREYEDAELNENFVRSNLLTPKIVVRESHRDGRPSLGFSRDLDSGDEDRLSPSFPRKPRRGFSGSGFSTPDRRSDGELSSDHEDSSSAGTSGKNLTNKAESM